MIKHFLIRVMAPCLGDLMIQVAVVSRALATSVELTLERKHYGSWEQNIGYTQVICVGNQLYLGPYGQPTHAAHANNGGLPKVGQNSQRLRRRF